MSQDLEAIFAEWKIPQVFIDKLKEQEVNDLETLLLLSDDDVKDIFHKVGPRATFTSQLRKLRSDFHSVFSDFSMTVSELEDVAFEVIKEELKNLDKLKKAEASSSHACGSSGITVVSNDNETSSGQETIDGDTGRDTASAASSAFALGVNTDLGALSGLRPLKRSATCDYRLNFDLREIMKCTDGKIVLSAALQNMGELSGEYRSMLADIIINDFIKEDHDRRLPVEMEEVMTSAIIDLFPNEEKDIWMSPSTTGRSKACGRGLLLTRYYNKRRILRKVGLIKKTLPSTELADTDGDDPTDALTADDLLWLSNNKQPWSKVLSLWKSTQTVRRHKLIRDKMAVADYITLYPPLQDKSGYLLLESDYEMLFPDTSMNLFVEWPMLAAFVATQVPPSVKEEINSLNTSEGKMVRTIQSLPYLFPVVTAAKRGKHQWRPSRQEAGEALLLHVQTNGDVAVALASRLKDKYDVYGLHLAPQAVVVGTDEDNISTCYVRVNNVLYEVENPKKALDIAFKIIHSLDTEYHKECEREWCFLERAVYGLNQGKKSPLFGKVCSAVKDYAVFKQNSS